MYPQARGMLSTDKRYFLPVCFHSNNHSIWSRQVPDETTYRTITEVFPQNFQYPAANTAQSIFASIRQAVVAE